ncbi:MAG TPA: hypothetical protein VFF30_03090 [Nitrososphaerales archaeon]|nr:hypothetical protein [Nitrososphaerales archaeon]
MVDITRVSKAINAPLNYVYNWCTDFSEDDPKITGSRSQRKILQKTSKQVVYAQLYEGADGKPKVAVDIVTLNPSKKTWHLDYFGEEDDETGDYKLTSVGKNKTKLDMVFKERWKNISTVPTKEEQVEQTSRIWDKYIAALEREYNSS